MTSRVKSNVQTFAILVTWAAMIASFVWFLAVANAQIAQNTKEIQEAKSAAVAAEKRSDAIENQLASINAHLVYISKEIDKLTP